MGVDGAVFPCFELLEEIEVYIELPRRPAKLFLILGLEPAHFGRRALFVAGLVSGHVFG